MTDLPPRLAAALSDRYTLERRLGEGGMASVYLAHDVKHDRSVAIKVLRPELAAVIGAERFLAEIRTTANLQHPHILPLFDSGEADGFLWYAMPHVEGESLRDRLDREKQLPVDEAVRLAVKVAGALQAAHEMGVIHRDIKPANVLLDRRGEPLVADFGIALAVQHAGGRLTETGLSVGTPYYMSPEQATADRALDARSDVYSLACVLYEMLAGDPPHVASTAQAVLAKILTEEAPEVGTRRKAVPPNVEAALAKGLERLPADRFATAAAFAGALADPGYRDASSAARPALGAPSGPPRAAPWALAAALGALAAWSLLVGSGSEDAPVLRYALELPEGADLAHIEDSGRRFALAPDGSWLAWIAQGPAASRVWVRSRDRVEARPLEGTDNALELFAGPYGERIGVRVSFREDDGAQSQIFLLVPIEGGAPARLSRRGMMRSLAGVSWSDDGYLYWDVANFRGPSGIGRTPEDGGEDELVTRLDTASGEWDARSPMALPEGGGLLFTRAQEGEADVIVALDAEGRQTVVVEGRDAVYVHPGALAWVTEGGTLMAAPFDVRTFRITGPPVALDEGLALVGAAGYELAASREGTLAYVKGEPGPSPSRIAWVGRDGREEPVPLEWKGRVGSLSLSPDGRQVAFAGGTAIVIKDLETGAETPLTFDDANFSNPRWSSDGRSIVYAKNRTLREMDASGLGEERHLLGTGISGDLVFFGEWSPDRSWLVWNSGGMLNVRAAADTARRVRLPGEGSGRISPDGAWLATTGEGLMVRPFPDVEQGARQVSATGENPIWSRDGSELFYWDRETGALIAAEVLSGETFRVGARDTLFRGIPPSSAGQAGGFDVAPDGRFLVTRRGAPPRQSLMFIENLPRLVREAGANR